MPARIGRRLLGAALSALLILWSPGARWTEVLAQVVGEAAAGAVVAVPPMQAPLGLTASAGEFGFSPATSLPGPAFRLTPSLGAPRLAPTAAPAAHAVAASPRGRSPSGIDPAPDILAAGVRPAAPVAAVAAARGIAAAEARPVLRGAPPARASSASVERGSGRSGAPALSPKASLQAEGTVLEAVGSDSGRRVSLESFFAGAAAEPGERESPAVASVWTPEAKIDETRRVLRAALGDARFVRRLGRLLRAQRVHSGAMDLGDGRIAARLAAALDTLEIRFSAPKEEKSVRDAHAVYISFPYGVDRPYILFNSNDGTSALPASRLGGILLHELIHHEFKLGETTAVRAELLYYSAARSGRAGAARRPETSLSPSQDAADRFDAATEKVRLAAARGTLTAELLRSYGAEKLARSPDDRMAVAKHHLRQQRRIARVVDEIGGLMEKGAWEKIPDPAAWVRAKLPRADDAELYLGLVGKYVGRGQGGAGAALELLRGDLAGSIRTHEEELAKARLGGASAPQASPAAAASGKADAPVAAPEESIDPRTAFGLFAQRTVSIIAFIGVTIAFPYAAVPVVGPTGFGVLLALSPMAGIAAGPVNGMIVDRMSARTAMALNTLIRVVSLMALPAFHYFGVLNFGTLLIASLADGWLLSSIMTSEGAFMRRLFPAKALGTINALLYMNYLFLQVVLGLLLGIGQIVDKWNPFMVFAGASAINLVGVLPLIWAFIPNAAPPAARPAPAAAAAASAAPRARRPFFRRYGKEASLFLASAAAFALFTWLGPLSALAAARLGLGWAPALASFVGAHPALHAAVTSPLPIAAALLNWISRTDVFAALWRGESAEAPKDQTAPQLAAGRLRTSMIFLSLGALMMYPLQYFGLPLIAQTLAGIAGKGLLLGQFLGSLFFGNLISTAAQAKLPTVRLPFLRRPVEAQWLIQAGVAALAAAWVYTRLVPGSILAAAAALPISIGLMAYARRPTNRGWIKLIGAGFAAIWLPFAAWAWPAALPFLTVPTAIYASLVIIGMAYGPSYVSLITYFQKNTKQSEMGRMVGVQGSFFNSAISMGYAVITIIAALLAPAFPATLAVLGAFYALGGLLFWRAPDRLPGLEKTIFKPREPAEAPAPRR